MVPVKLGEILCKKERKKDRQKCYAFMSGQVNRAQTQISWQQNKLRCVCNSNSYKEEEEEVTGPSVLISTPGHLSSLLSFFVYPTCADERI